MSGIRPIDMDLGRRTCPPALVDEFCRHSLQKEETRPLETFGGQKEVGDPGLEPGSLEILGQLVEQVDLHYNPIGLRTSSTFAEETHALPILPVSGGRPWWF